MGTIVQPLLILFGSQATGHSRPDSDWDVAVVADHQLSLGELSAASEEAAGILGANEDKIDIADMWSASPLLQRLVLSLYTIEIDLSSTLFEFGE